MIFVGATAVAVHDALVGVSVDCKVLVLGAPRLAAALAERGRLVMCASPELRSLRRLGVPAAYAASDALPVADRHVSAVVASGLARTDDWQSQLAECLRVLDEDGVLVLVDRGGPAEQTRRALCAGLIDIEQRHAGRTVVTSGRVARLPAQLAG
jgi:NADPH:quinone reductase-like Zn-dependent oxidoreductase